MRSLRRYVAVIGVETACVVDREICTEYVDGYVEISLYKAGVDVTTPRMYGLDDIIGDEEIKGFSLGYDGANGRAPSVFYSMHDMQLSWVISYRYNVCLEPGKLSMYRIWNGRCVFTIEFPLRLCLQNLEK